MKNIKIKANLTPQEEAIEIAKELLKKPLLLSGSKIKVIGKEQAEIQELITTIQIQRIPQEKLMSVCSCCDTNFEKGTGFKIWVNYGGKKKVLEYCSTNCRQLLMDILPESRYSLKSTKINSIKFF